MHLKVMMIFRVILGITFMIMLAGISWTAEYPKPDRDPVPPGDPQQQLIREGIILHDRGDYDGAIAKYLQVLEENPDCVAALHEISYSLFAAERYPEALSFGRRGITYRSGYLATFYMLIGNCLDVQNDPKKAIRAYEAGLRLNPEEALLYYNRALTRLKQDRVEAAMDDLKKALYRKSDHPSSHLVLGSLWYERGFRIPALLALLRFLELEPSSSRSGEAFHTVTEIFNGLVQVKGEGDNKSIQIILPAKSSKKEGDFSVLETSLALALTSQAIIEDSTVVTEDAKLLGAFESFFAMLSEISDKPASRFAGRYYLPYFIQMKEKKWVAPWLYHILQSANLETIRAWREQNQVRLAYYQEWSQSYRWPREKD